MNKLTLTISLSLISAISLAQTTIGIGAIVNVGGSTIVATNGNVTNNGDLQFGSNAQLILDGTLNVTTNSPLTLAQLAIVNTGIKTLNGEVSIANQLNLSGGLLQVTGNLTMQNTATFSDNLDGTSYITGSLTHQGNGFKLFPIGTASQYAPIALEDVLGNDQTTTTMAVRAGGVSLSALPENVSAASNNWAWDFAATGFSGSTLNLPVLPGDETLTLGENLIGVVLEADLQGGAVRNLGGFSSSLNGLNSIISRDATLGDTRTFLLGAELSLTPIIHNIITPNNDDSNDYLIIDAISAYADDNEVILLDRWGVEVYRKQNFTNFNDTDNPYDGSFDDLPPGNYICILKYAGQTAKQVITVLN